MSIASIIANNSPQTNLIYQSQELFHNITLAIKICNYVNGRLVPCNNSNSPVVIRKITEIRRQSDSDVVAAAHIEAFIDSITQSVKTVREQSREHAQKMRQEARPNLQRDIMWMKAEVAEQYGAGNCMEMTAVGCAYAKNKRKRIEAFCILGGDHHFIVIERAFGSDPTQPFTWGPNAVVCDPWTNEAYPAHHTSITLKNYISSYQDLLTRVLVTHIEPFDPRRHTLHPYFECLGRIYPIHGSL